VILGTGERVTRTSEMQFSGAVGSIKEGEGL